VLGFCWLGNDVGTTRWVVRTVGLERVGARRAVPAWNESL